MASDTTGIVDVSKIEVLQEQAQNILNEYIKNTCQPTEATVRFGRLLLAVSLLKMVRATTIETLFFRETVGDTSVMRLLQDMYMTDMTAPGPEGATGGEVFAPKPLKKESSPQTHITAALKELCSTNITASPVI